MRQVKLPRVLNSLAIAALLTWLDSSFYPRPTMLQQARATRARRATLPVACRVDWGASMLPAA